MLECVYAGVKLRSPVIVSSAGITGTVGRMKRCEENGAGAVVVKSLFEAEVTRIAPTPRFKVIKRDRGAKSSVMYSYEQASEWGPERHSEEIRNAKKALKIPVIASINCVTDKGWIEYAKLMQDSGADMLELNMSCPHGPQIMSDMDIVKTFRLTTEIVRKAVDIPIIPKMTPQLTDPMSVAKMLEDAGADAVVMFNRFTGLDIDVEDEKPVMHGGYAGHGGSWALHYPLRWISAISPKLKIDVSASGGVSSWEDVVKYLLAGAKTVQVCTAVVVGGYGIIAGLKNGLEEWMTRKKYKSMDEFRGKICSKILSMDEVDRTHKYRAGIDESVCSGCGTCFKVCIYNAVEKDKKIYRTNKNCDGCGLCVDLCSKSAINLYIR